MSATLMALRLTCRGKGKHEERTLAHWQWDSAGNHRADVNHTRSGKALGRWSDEYRTLDMDCPKCSRTYRYRADTLTSIANRLAVAGVDRVDLALLNGIKVNRA